MPQKSPQEIAAASLALWEGLAGKFEPEPEPDTEEDYLPEDTLFGGGSEDTLPGDGDTIPADEGEDTTSGGIDFGGGSDGDDTLS